MALKIMVALRYPETLDSLMTLACQMAEGTQGELVALHVVEVPAATPIDADDAELDRQGNELLARAKRFAQERFSKKITARLLRARRAGEAIVGQAKEEGVGTLILSYHRRSALGEILLGSSVQYALHHTPCRVLVEVTAPRRA